MLVFLTIFGSALSAERTICFDAETLDHATTRARAEAKQTGTIVVLRDMRQRVLWSSSSEHLSFQPRPRTVEGVRSVQIARGRTAPDADELKPREIVLPRSTTFIDPSSEAEAPDASAEDA